MPIRTLKRFAQRPRADQAAMLQAMAVIGGFWAALRLLPFPKVERIALMSRHKASAREPASRIIWAIKTAGRYLPGATCLPQALAAYVLLTRAGHDCRIQIGVGRDELNRFKAHAWVVLDGQIVVGATPDHYTPLTALEMRS